MWWGCGLTLAMLAFWLRQPRIVAALGAGDRPIVIYVMIFQLTPEDLTWHLGSAMPRLLFHVGPLAFLAATWSILEAEEEVGGRS